MNTNQLLQIFQYSNHQVRTTGTSEAPLFVAQDVCQILELSDPDQAVRRLDEDERLLRTIYGSGQGRDMWTINEPGLYSLVLTSRKPEAKAFKKWITSEVLPSIRQTGSYTVKPMSTAEVIHAQSGILVEHERKIAQLETNQQQLQAQLEQAQSKLNEQERFLCANPESFRSTLVSKVRSYAYNTGNHYPEVWSFLYKQL